MTRHSFDHGFRITPAQKKQFERDGFVKLPGFLNANVVEMLLHRVDAEMGRDAEKTTAHSLLKRVTYDHKGDKGDIFELLERPYFRRALTDLVERDLFFTFELFEVEKNVSPGQPWQVGVQSFGYQFAREFGCNIWAPLHPVNANGQRGGVACVPRPVISGEWVFEMEAAVVSTLKAREEAGVKTSLADYFELRHGILNSPVMLEIMENHQVEDDFEPGDVLVFHKMVVHKSIRLEEGELSRRAAHVLRFIDAGSHYDLQRAQDLDYPIRQYRKELLPYKPIARQHIELAEAGAVHGDLLAESAYFSDRGRRMIRRQRPLG
ncbi:MAG: hypothetical protein F4W89_15785 [Acidobacteria bacterium]|nr:hypothetical protein [Acidobacteriota bacterium]